MLGLEEVVPRMDELFKKLDAGGDGEVTFLEALAPGRVSSSPPPSTCGGCAGRRGHALRLFATRVCIFSDLT